MSTKKKVNSAKGRRYTRAEKADILAYVEQVNSQKGRGGQSAASKKFKISPLTISSWIRSGYGESSGIPAMPGVGSSGPIGKKLAKLQALHDQITRMEKELSKTKAQFNALKSSL
ncbi:hypothetical protein [Haloferula sp.]|uniref:hypothetical protein n=1 Tax=Haloferula sp. TaxID=2497595 RepID=UPI003C71A13A